MSSQELGYLPQFEGKEIEEMLMECTSFPRELGGLVTEYYTGCPFPDESLITRTRLLGRLIVTESRDKVDEIIRDRHNPERKGGFLLFGVSFFILACFIYLQLSSFSASTTSISTSIALSASASTSASTKLNLIMGLSLLFIICSLFKIWTGEKDLFLLVSRPLITRFGLSRTLEMHRIISYLIVSILWVVLMILSPWSAKKPSELKVSL